MIEVWFGVIIHSHLSFSVCSFLLVRDDKFSTSLSQMIKFTLTDVTTQSLYDAQVIQITSVKIIAAIICHCVSYYFVP